MMTGRYATRFGFEFTPTPKQFMQLIDHTVHLGKWHLGDSPQFQPHAHGFKETLSLMHGASMFLPENDPKVVNAKQDCDPIDKFLWASHAWGIRRNDGVPFQPPRYLTDYLTDEAVKVVAANENRPFFMYLAYSKRWPAVLPKGRSYTQPVSHFDIFATTAAAAGQKLPSDRVVDGVNLLPFIRGETPGQAHEALFWRSDSYRSMREGDWKLQVTELPKQDWLDNLATDPGEKNNLADKEPTRVAAMKTKLQAWDKAQRKPLWPSLAEGPIAIDKSPKHPMLGMIKGMPLRALAPFSEGRLTDEVLAKLDVELAKL